MKFEFSLKNRNVEANIYNNKATVDVLYFALTRYM